MIEGVMIFAAGFGTRMGDLTSTTPKPLLNVSGRPLIDHALDYVDEAGIPKVVVNTHYLAEQLHQHLQSKNVLISHEETKILDTGGGLREALPLLGTDIVFTLNPDVLWLGPNPLTFLKHAWNPQTMDALLLCTPLPRTFGRTGSGDFRTTPDGHIERGGDLVYGGAQIIKTDGLHDIAQDTFSLNVLWDRLNDAGRLHLVEYPGRWCDVGTPEGIALAESLMDQTRV